MCVVFAYMSVCLYMCMFGVYVYGLLCAVYNNDVWCVLVCLWCVNTCVCMVYRPDGVCVFVCAIMCIHMGVFGG